MKLSKALRRDRKIQRRSGGVRIPAHSKNARNKEKEKEEREKRARLNASMIENLTFEIYQNGQ